MPKGSDDLVRWNRKPDCKAHLRGVSPWACNIVQHVLELPPEDSETVRAYREGTLRLLEQLAPECIECLQEKTRNKGG